MNRALRVYYSVCGFLQFIPMLSSFYRWEHWGPESSVTVGSWPAYQWRSTLPLWPAPRGVCPLHPPQIPVEVALWPGDLGKHFRSSMWSSGFPYPSKLVIFFLDNIQCSRSLTGRYSHSGDLLERWHPTYRGLSGASGCLVITCRWLLCFADFSILFNTDFWELR